MLDTNADSWATLPEILIQLVAIASVTQEPYFEKHCWVNFRQTNNYCTYTGVFILSFSGVLRIPKGWRRVHISRSWEACSFPLIHSGRPSYLLYVLDFDKIFLVFYRLCINKPESETLKIISFSFLSSEWKWLHQHLILHRTLGGGKPTQGFFFFFGSVSQQEVSDMWILKMAVLEEVVSIFLTLDKRPPVISWCILASP